VPSQSKHIHCLCWKVLVSQNSHESSRVNFLITQRRNRVTEARVDVILRDAWIVLDNFVFRPSLRQESPRGVLIRAQVDGRVLVTFDKDFGELAFRFNLPASYGIVLFRILPSSPSRVARLALASLESRDDWAGQIRGR
jgi:predicted nuclease of predicted toxin-antitoxin system